VTLDVLFLDNHLLVVCKPAGMLTQADRSGALSLLEAGRAYIKQRFDKPGNVFLGLVHRLDRPVSGVVVLARRLSAQFRQRQATKVYWALVQGRVAEEGAFIDRLLRTAVHSQIVPHASGQVAELRFHRLGYGQGVSWVEIHLGTGRHHQIRAQFAHHGHPVLGDRRYGATVPFAPGVIALHARALTVAHPTLHTPMTFTAEPERLWQWPARSGRDGERARTGHRYQARQGSG
jgi:23S rRNA-/tRNA-specific pseudouridylate synthase